MANVDTIQVMHDTMSKAWANRPSEKATHYDPVHRGYYSVCEFYSDATLYVWCGSNNTWIQVDDDQLVRVLERLFPFYDEHKLDN